MRPPPPCTGLGRQCRELTVTLRIAQMDEDDAEFHDAAGTWLLGHTERIVFGDPFQSGNRLLVEGLVRVGCRYLREGQERQEGGSAAWRCAAYGFRGSLPPIDDRGPRPAFNLGGGMFTIVQGRRRADVTLLEAQTPIRALPVLESSNPCIGAPCRTADNRRGAACCRDLTLEVVAPEADGTVEALLRSRRSPYLCKVVRVGPDLIECEVISACGYLDADGISCSLHGRERPGGAPAKPSICSDWPDLDPGSPGHPGCRLVPAVATSAASSG